MSLPITAVTVHRDGALVTRSGPLPVVDGAVVVGGLPLLLDARSVRAEVEGAAIAELRLALALGDADRPEETDLDAAVRATIQREQRLQAELDALRTWRGRLRALVPQGPGDADQDRPSASQLLRWAQVEPQIDGQAAELDGRITELERTLETATEARVMAEFRARSQSSATAWARWLPRREVHLSLAEASETVTVTVSYGIIGALWSPAYELHADHLFRRGRFVVRALVANATGEDWSGVSLALSTAPLLRRVDLPELPARRLGSRQPPRPSPWRELPEGLDALFPAELAPPPQSQPTSTVIVDVEEADEEPTGNFLPPPAPMPAMQAQAAYPMEMERSMAPRSSKGGAAGLLGAVVGAPLAVGAAAAEAVSDAWATREEARSLSRAPGGGGYGGLTTEADPSMGVSEQGLDYPRLRMGAWDADVTQRGRLRTVDLGYGLPPGAKTRLQAEQSRIERLMGVLKSRRLPAHHVLPEPVEEADLRFDAQQSVELPSDGELHSVALASEPVELSVRYRTVPRSDPRVFRRVRAELSLGPLLPGPADVYVDGALELTTAWAGAAGHGELEMSLGVEDRLQVARNVRYDEASAGMFGGSRKLSTEIEVEVASSLSRAVRVDILDRVPLPGTDDVRVDLGECSPMPREYGGDDDGPVLEGGKVQTVDVPAAGRFVAQLRYTVTISAKDELAGGDRRG